MGDRDYTVRAHCVQASG